MLAVIQHASQFWPTVTRAGTALAAVGGVIAAAVSNYNRAKLQEVHVLVNGELHNRLQRLDDLTGKLVEVTAERDAVKATLAAAPSTPTETPPEVTK